MAGSTTIREALERNARAVQLKPSVGQGTAVTKIRLHPGLRCDVEEGAWKFTVGMSEKYGGTNAGPNPGVYGRAAWGRALRLATGCGPPGSAYRSMRSMSRSRLTTMPAASWACRTM